MAKIDRTGILFGQVIESQHVTNIIDALDGTAGTELIVSGTLGISGSVYFNTASLGQSAVSAVLTLDTASGQLSFTSSAEFGVIGTPADGLYTDGFFDTFTSTTKISDAIDEISEAFLDLAPPKAPVLTNTNLTRTNPAIFSGRLAGGLNSTDWYVGTSAYSTVTTLTDLTNVTLTSIGFRAGKNSNITASLEGGVTASRSEGSNAYSIIGIRDLASGNGSTGDLTLTNTSQYNTFWAQATASISSTITVTGSNRYTVAADNGAGISNAFQLLYVGADPSADFPNQTVTTPTSETSSVSLKYLSGIPHLSSATFAIGFTGSNLFNPVYNTDQISFTSTYFSTLNTGSNSPQFGDSLILDVTRTLLINKSSGITNPDALITATKPGKTNITSTFTLATRRVNSYGTADTQGDSQSILFLDEDYRMSDLQDSSLTWLESSTLANGNLQVMNGRLIVGEFGDYPALTQGGSVAGYADYFRRSDPSSDNRQNGTLALTRIASAFGASNPIAPWNSGTGEMEMALVLSSDITGPSSATAVYDLGRVVGDDSGIIKGIRNTTTTNNTTNYNITWALPPGINTGLAASTHVVLWVRYNNCESGDYLTQITLAYS